MIEMQPTGQQADGEALVTIVLIDDHAILRQGLRSLLEREHDLQVVGEASSPGEALAVVPGRTTTGLACVLS
jgi:two-component system response regulator DevR